MFPARELSPSIETKQNIFSVEYVGRVLLLILASYVWKDARPFRSAINPGGRNSGVRVIELMDKKTDELLEQVEEAGNFLARGNRRA